MAIRPVQNTCIHNRRKTIHNYTINVPSKKRRHLATNFDSILLVVAKDNDILELQGLLEHNNFIDKPKIRIKQMLCIKQA
jgi:hypothetical protein